jgi:16S rRNA processing protein RimM
LAQIRRTQGRKGEVFSELLTDFPDKFSERRQLWLLPADAPAPSPSGVLSVKVPNHSNAQTRDTRSIAVAPGLDSEPRNIADPGSNARPVDLTSHWLHKGGIVLHFAGVDSISAAELLKGLVVAIPNAQRAQLAEGETYISDLVGCTLVDVSGAASVTIGKIEDVDRASGPVPLLILHGPRGEVLIPFAKSYLRQIDLASKRVEMALPAGLADLNTTH